MNQNDKWRSEREWQLEAFQIFVIFGFIIRPITINNTEIVFKSLTEDDLDKARSLEDIIALSIFSIDGVIVYDPRIFEEDLDSIYKLIQNTTGLFYILLEETWNWFDWKRKRLINVFEEFIESTESRNLWLEYKHGIYPLKVNWEPRFSSPGISYVWAVTNEREDTHSDHEVMWNMLRVAVAGWNAEYAKKLPDTYYVRQTKYSVENTLIPPVKTAKDLVNQLDAVVRGEKDDHDLIIEEIERTWAQEASEKTRELEQKMKDREKLTENQLIGVSMEVIEDTENA